MIAIYLLANVAYLSVLDVETIRHSRLVAAEVAAKLLGAPGVVFVAVTVMLSTFGTLNGSIMTAPRMFFAMADDGCSFARSRRCTRNSNAVRRHRAQCGDSALGSCSRAASSSWPTTFVIAIVPFLALAVGAVFGLRRRKGYDTSFRVPGYPVVPLIFIASTIALLVNAVVDHSSRVATLGVFVGILLGLPVYAVIVRRMGSSDEGTQNVTSPFPSI